jgi:hypothetical protein
VWELQLPTVGVTSGESDCPSVNLFLKCAASASVRQAARTIAHIIEKNNTHTDVRLSGCVAKARVQLDLLMDEYLMAESVAMTLLSFSTIRPTDWNCLSAHVCISATFTRRNSAKLYTEDLYENLS